MPDMFAVVGGEPAGKCPAAAVTKCQRTLPEKDFSNDIDHEFSNLNAAEGD
jgi:hypothetical protein